MGFESETLLVVKYNSETVEIVPTTKSTNCDNKPVFTLEKFLKFFISKNDIATTIRNITSLDLSNCNLRDLPPDLYVLNLKHFNLSQNKFGQVPACLYNGLNNLELLDLSYNQIEVFDREPDCVLNLRIVNLCNNKMKNVPKWFLMFKAVNLEEFNYSNNRAKHYNYLKNSFNSSRNILLKLELRNCQLIDTDYIFLRQFKHLRYLDIGNESDKTSNSFREIDELFVKLKWRQLSVLSMNYLGIVIFPTGILWLESLVELHFNGNYISWLPQDIKYMINLEVLEVSNNFLVNLPDNLVYLKDLRIIKASDNVIQRVPDFNSMEQLEILDLYNNSLEELSLNINVLKCVDIENNCLKVETLDFYTDYVKKKNRYRETFSNNRQDGFKSEPYCCEDDLEKDENSFDGEGGKIITEPVVTEDWEQDQNSNRKYTRSSDIDTDDDWNGDHHVNKSGIEIRKTEKIYLLDEDWMFEDACEDWC